MPTRLQRHILQLSAFLSYVQFEPDLLSAPNSDKHRIETEQPHFKYWLLFLISSSVFFGLYVEFVVVTTICEMSD